MAGSFGGGDYVPPSNIENSPGDIKLTTAPGVGPTPNICLETGAASAGDSGEIKLQTGTAPGNRGPIKFIDGSEGNVGDVWVSKGVSGEGGWQSPTVLSGFLLLSGGTMSGTINMDSNTITNLPEPTLTGEPATKNYADTTVWANSQISQSAVTQHEGALDHNGLLNTHNLTTDINHNTILNNHNLTTDIDHDTITNAHNLTTDIDHNTILNNHNLTTDIDHATITNTHNLTTDIDHDQLTNFVLNEHVDHTAVSISGGTSLSGGGDISANRTLTLLNDNATPGNTKYYGTDGGGTKGWFDLTAAVASGFATTALDNLSGVAINTDLIFGGGVEGIIKTLGYTSGALNTEDIELQTGELSSTATGATGRIDIRTGNALNVAAGGSGLIQIVTGLAQAGGQSGSLTLATGGANVGATVGNILITTGNASAAAVGASGTLDLKTGVAANGDSSGPINLTTGNGDDSGRVFVQTGIASNGNSGDVVFNIRTATVTQGEFKFLKEGVAPTIGDVWTASAVDGSGYWAAAGGGFANTTLSNLGAVDLNADLTTTKASTLTVGHDAVGENIQFTTALSAVATDTGEITLRSGSTSTGTGISGAITIDSGTSTKTSGQINITSGHVSGLPVGPPEHSGAIFLTTGQHSNAANTKGTGAIWIRSGLNASSTSGGTGQIRIITGVSGGATAVTGELQLRSGDASLGSSGNILISPGTAGTVRGSIRLQDGSEGTSGFVWASTGILGEGAWTDPLSISPGGAYGTVLPGGSSLSGTYEGNLVVTGNADLSGNVIVKGDLLIEGNLENVESHSLTVKQDCFVEGYLRFVPGGAETLGSITIGGDLYVGQADLAGTFNGTVQTGFSTTTFDYTVDMQAAGVVIGSSFTVISGVGFPASGTVTNIAGTTVLITPALSGTPLAGDIHQYGITTPTSLVMKRNSNAGVGELIVGGDLHCHDIDGIPQDGAVAGLDVTIGGDVFGIGDQNNTRLINLSGLSDAGNSGNLDCKGALNCMNVTLQGADSTLVGAAGTGGDLFAGSYNSFTASGVIQDTIQTLGGNHTGASGNGGASGIIIIQGDTITSNILTRGGNSTNGVGGAVSLLRIYGKAIFQTTFLALGGTGATGGGNLGAITFEGPCSNPGTSSIQAIGGQATVSGSGGSTNQLRFNDIVNVGSITLQGGSSANGPGGSTSSLLFLTHMFCQNAVKIEGGDSNGGAFSGGTPNGVTFQSGANVGTSIQSLGGDGATSGGNAANIGFTEGACLADSISSIGGSSAGVNGRPGVINFKQGCQVRQILHQHGAGAGSISPTRETIAITGTCIINEIDQDTTGDLRISPNAGNPSSFNVNILTTKNIFYDVAGNPTANQSVLCQTSQYKYDHTNDQWIIFTGAAI